MAMADGKPNANPAVTTGYALVNKYGTIVGIFADKEALYANIPYGKEFFTKMDSCLERPWRIRKIPIFNSHENNTLTRDIIKLGKQDMLDIIERIY